MRLGMSLRPVRSMSRKSRPEELDPWSTDIAEMGTEDR